MKVFDCAADSPSIVSVHVLASGFCGGIPLFLTKNREAGVTASSSKCAGVSALIGRSLSIVSPSFPSIEKGVFD